MPPLTRVIGRPGRVIMLAALLGSPALASPAFALDTTTYRPQPTQTVAPPQPDESQLLEHRHYQNVDGKEVHSPAHTKGDVVPSGASARCGDGSYSFSLHHRGTCSHHGGVSEWLGG
ncbi:DUF3761 domain-containing protein [Acetobacter sacchari]|uniref:DUF3761 domain-containing protein n=1 Tax=Acetobacter sacchari TaxID=2661687 RepID=A0ABS3M1B1_9PROT|nr:DUF3761 domain-containing protein [Acetobacter sacchari]MBO1361941.1 DUF3761 domain-containing protein [Acetobacter sacchari]